MKPTILIVYAVDEERINNLDAYPNFVFCKTGIGKVNAALKVSEAIRVHQPALVVNIGTAGSVHHEVGSIHLCNEFIDRDMEKLHAFGVPYREKFEAGHALLPTEWQFSSTCNTGDTFLTNADGKGDVFDMESYAIARACKHHSVPFVAIKYVTDKIGENSIKHWEEKLSEAKLALEAFTMSLVNKFDFDRIAK
jgi:adenosylhomocysteine nucleosidase